ncbi:MAG: diguanylate cyclase [Acidobacteria bacterium]|nr:diguanylate cyclase [Acidobacteriota bacterium]
MFLFFAGCPRVSGQYRFDSWTTDNGLPQNGIRGIAQTPDGYLWFTTFDGLVRFDGVRFTTFAKGTTKGIINNRFTGIYCDRDGTLYATTMENGVLTVYRDGNFTSYTADQVPERYIRRFRRDANDELTVEVETGDATTETWYYLRDGEFVFKEKYAKKDAVVTQTGRDGRVWTLTPEETTETRPDGTRFVYAHHIDNFNSSVAGYEDREGGLWIGGLTLARLKDGRIESFGEEAGFPPRTDFHSFWEDDEGALWFANGGVTNPGLGLVRYRNGAFTVFSKEAGLTDTSIQGVFRDREGTIWLATQRGLNRLRKKVITAAGTAEGLSNAEVYPIYRDRENNIWVGTAKGLNLYRDGRFEPVDFKQRGAIPTKTDIWVNEDISIQSLLEDSHGKLWIGVAGGIYLAENGYVELVEAGSGHHTQALYEDAEGTVWAATSKGLLRFRDYRLERAYTTADGLPADIMTVIFADSQGRLWFGGYGGLSQFSNGRFINYTDKEGLAGNYVRTIYEDDEGTLWIGTYDEGLSRFKDGKFFNYRAAAGLYNNGVFAIREDARHDFWISSNGGIYRVSRRQLNEFADGLTDRLISTGYGTPDGMLNNECNGGRQPSSLEDEQGRFWFPTQDGIAIVDPSMESHNPMPPAIVIESATVEREQVSVRGGLTIEPGGKNIEINFTGISLIKSDQIKFKYKLEGHDTDWIDAGTHRTANYSYLPPGTYRFLVTAANSDGIWNAEGASLNIELKPFFYQTWEFYLALLAVATVSLLIIWKYSVRQLEARERLLEKLVNEKTEALKKVNEELQLLANSDGLTKVGNRRMFEEFIKAEWHRAIRFKTEISLIMIDIDHFKLYNDAYGHQAGDECLRRVAAALKATIHRPTDIVARFGGEEFAIVLGGTDLEGAMKIATEAADNVRALEIQHRKSPTCATVTISVGVATTLVQFGMEESELIRAADEALYQAKADGRNRISSNHLSLDFVEISVLEKEFLGIH